MKKNFQKNLEKELIKNINKFLFKDKIKNIKEIKTITIPNEESAISATTLSIDYRRQVSKYRPQIVQMKQYNQ